MRPKLEDVDRGMTGLFAYPFVLMAVFIPFRFVIDSEDIGSAVNGALYVTALRLAPLGIFLFFSMERVFHAFRAASSEDQPTLTRFFGAFLLLSWIPVYRAAQGAITLKVIAPEGSEEAMVASIFETFAGIATFMAEEVFLIYLVMGFIWVAQMMVSILERDNDPYTKMYELNEKHEQRRRDEQFKERLIRL